MNEYPLRYKYTLGLQADTRGSSKGSYRPRTGNSNGRKKGRHKLEAEEKRRGMFGYFPFVPRTFRLVGGKLR